MANEIGLSRPGDERVSRQARTQMLEPGSYWRSKVALAPIDPGHREIAAGTVLLLARIDYFEGLPHTITLAAHPLWGKAPDLPFLTDAFLDCFEPAPDGEAVRAREMASLQEEITALQQEMLRGQHDPAVMAPAIAAALRTEAAAKGASPEDGKGASPEDGKGASPEDGKGASPEDGKAPAQATLPAQAHDHAVRQVRGAAHRDLGGLLASRPDDGDLAALREAVNHQAVIARAKADWIKARTEAIAEKLATMSGFFSEQAAAALARTSDARASAESLLEGLASLDLYTGKCVHTTRLASGAAAGADEPLTLMQRKLFIDEELAAWMDVAEDFDAGSIAAFDQRLAEEPGLRDQLLPAPRCVVSCAIRRRDLDYGDPFASVARNAANARVFLLVRNGENLYRVTSESPSHEAAARLFPTHDEHARIFRGIDGSRIGLNDVRFTRANRRSASLSLHYQRFLILLCGLDHREHLFGRFYPEAEAGQFLRLDFQARYFRFVADDESDRLLGDAHPSVEEYIAGCNAGVQSGSRVFCYYPDLLTPENAPACARYVSGERSVALDVLASPARTVGLHVVSRHQGRFCIKVPVVRTRWREEGAQTTFNARVSLPEPPGAGLGAGYLGLDQASAPMLRHYIENRSARTAHTAYIRLFKHALAALEADARAEADSRACLARAAREAGLGTEAALVEHVDAAIRAWRVANRGAPLPDACALRALAPILDQVYTLSHAASLAERIETAADGAGLTVLRLAVTGKGQIALYHTLEPDPRVAALYPWRWVGRSLVRPGKRTIAFAPPTTAWLNETGDPAETTLKDYPAIDAWAQAGRAPADPRVIARLAADADDQVARFDERFAAEGIESTCFESLYRAFHSCLYNGKGRYVPSTHIRLALGLVAERGRGMRSLVLRARAEQWLMHFGSAAQRARTRNAFLGIYRDEAHAEELLDAPLQVGLWLHPLATDAPITITDQHLGLAIAQRHNALPADTLEALRARVGEAEGLLIPEALPALLTRLGEAMQAARAQHLAPGNR
ncbi:hypothetical protein J2T57_001435 [Natronocella acetinitrilica]|uniref:Uncharacterized protein n=1 Tax=Natronocella acetinitrilica TaxID=414046 RepID=A0AAE3G368_9GAMM|nr:hypothetical protein [Natronocella acetinitrilica]MCP1674333.1 hypothetical protein [Natronocella acetinitrilica]